MTNLLLVTSCMTVILHLSVISSCRKVLEEVILFLILLIMRKLGIAILRLKLRRVEVEEHILSMQLEVQCIACIEVTYKGFAPLC